MLGLGVAPLDHFRDRVSSSELLSQCLRFDPRTLIPVLSERAVVVIFAACPRISGRRLSSIPGESRCLPSFLSEEVGSMYAIDPRRGWGNLAEGGIETYPVAGDNLSLFDAGMVEALAEKLRSCIARVP